MRKLQRLVALVLLAAMAILAVPVPVTARTTPAPLANTERYPVIFIPGIAVTELDNRDELVWINVSRLVGSHLPGFNLFNMNWMLPLRLSADGDTPYLSDYEIRVGQIMGHGVTDAYSGLIDSFERLGYVEGKDLSYAETVEQGLAPHNATLARQAPAYHDRLLNGKDYGVMQFIMAGKGHKTLVGFTERKGLFGIRQKTDRFTDGDEMVPLHSGDLGFSKDPRRAQRYIGRVVSFKYAEADHILFAQSGDVQSQVADWLMQIHIVR